MGRPVRQVRVRERVSRVGSTQFIRDERAIIRAGRISVRAETKHRSGKVAVARRSPRESDLRVLAGSSVDQYRVDGGGNQFALAAERSTDQSFPGGEDAVA